MRPAILDDPDLAPVLAALPRARLVGGCVRDTLIGEPAADIDLATPDLPDAVQASLAAAGLRTIPTGLSHGTITALSGPCAFEITTLRRDEATDGRHAEIAWTDDWREDAARRDFTFNAMSLDQAGELHDYFNGLPDLRAGRVRFVGDPAARIAEDYLRILRFFRFYARYGHRDPGPEVLAAISTGIAGLHKLSAERIWAELKRILATPDPSGAIVLMADLGVLAAILPEATNPDALAGLLARHAPPDPLLRLAALLSGSPAALGERLRLSIAERDRLALLKAAPTPDPGHDEATIRRALADTPRDILIDRTWLKGGAGREWQALRQRLAGLEQPVFPLEGRDALALGAVPGPHIGKALAAVSEWWRAGGCNASPKACRDKLREILMPLVLK